MLIQHLSTDTRKHKNLFLFLGIFLGAFSTYFFFFSSHKSSIVFVLFHLLYQIVQYCNQEPRNKANIILHQIADILYASNNIVYEKLYIYIYIYTNLPVDVIVRLPHLRSGDSQGQETFLAPTADTQTRNYDIECSNHLLTLRPKGLSRSKMKW